jgi:hypothetical protein
LIIDLFRWGLRYIDNIARTENVTGPCCLTVQPNESITNQLLKTRTRKSRQLLREKTIQPQSRRFFWDKEPESCRCFFGSFHKTGRFIAPPVVDVTIASNGC